MRHDRRCFGRLEQEDQRLKKHYDRWMDIVRSLELESFILTKLTKPSVPVNLVGPQVSLPLWWVPASRGSFHFFVRNKEALPCVRRYSWWVRAVIGSIHSFWHNKEVLSCVRPWTICVPTVSLSMYVSLPGCRLLTTLPHRAENTSAMDDGETQEGNDPEAAKPQQWTDVGQ